MRWLVHGDLPAAVAEALRRHGHEARTPADAKIEADDPLEVLRAAHTLQLDIVTADPRLPGAAEQLGKRFGRSIVSIQTDPQRSEAAIDRLFERYKRLSPGRVYTVTDGRVKVRQLPGKP